MSALAAVGVANLVSGAEGLGAMDTESMEMETTTEQFMEPSTAQCMEPSTEQFMEPSTEPRPSMIGLAAREGLVAPSNC